MINRFPLSNQSPPNSSGLFVFDENCPTIPIQIIPLQFFFTTFLFLHYLSIRAVLLYRISKQKLLNLRAFGALRD